MKNVLLCSVALINVALCTSTALAADLPSRRVAPAYAPPAISPAFTWSGAYGGVNVGGGFNDYTSYGLSALEAAAQTTLNRGGRPGYLLTNSSGVVAGGQIGYNFQMNQGLLGNTLTGLGSSLTPITGLLGLGVSSGPVVGIEADADYTGFRQTVSALGTTGLTTIASSRQQFLGTVRGRVGYGFGNVLLYGTGGFAYGGVNDNLTTVNMFNGFGAVNRIQTGYTYGGGMEYAIPTSSFLNVFRSSAVTLKIEYLHYVLGDNVGTVVNTEGMATYTARVQNYGNIARVGVNYKIDMSPAPNPVVARY